MNKHQLISLPIFNIYDWLSICTCTPNYKHGNSHFSVINHNQQLALALWLIRHAQYMYILYPSIQHTSDIFKCSDTINSSIQPTSDIIKYHWTRMSLRSIQPYINALPVNFSQLKNTAIWLSAQSAIIRANNNSQTTYNGTNIQNENNDVSLFHMGITYGRVYLLKAFDFQRPRSCSRECGTPCKALSDVYPILKLWLPKSLALYPNLPSNSLKILKNQEDVGSRPCSFTNKKDEDDARTFM